MPVAPLSVVPVAEDGPVVAGAGAVVLVPGVVADGAVWSVGVAGVVPVVSVFPVDGVVIVPLVLPDVLLVRSLGMSTVSIAWMMPLVAMMSACVTVASLIFTVPAAAVTCRVLPSKVGGEVGEVMDVAVAASTRAGSTWYLSTAASLVGSFSRSFSAPLGSFLKAALVGANTVNGPGPCKALTRSAFFSSFTKVLNRLSLIARATMSLVGVMGMDMPDPVLIGGVMVEDVDIGDDGDIIPIEPLFLSAMVPVAS